MAKDKSPYRGYSLEEVRTMEDNHYVLNFGRDFIVYEGFYLFTPKEATKIYRETLRNVLGMVKSGNEKDREYALDLLGKLIVQPMRLH